MAQQPEVTMRGAFDTQVCVPADWSDEQVKSFADTHNLCGTEAGWHITREGDEHLRGDPERRQCESRAGFVHVMLHA